MRKVPHRPVIIDVDPVYHTILTMNATHDHRKLVDASAMRNTTRNMSGDMHSSDDSTAAKATFIGVVRF